MKWTLEHSHLILLSRELCFKRVQLPPPAYFRIQILCASVTCSIESVIFCSIFTSCGTFHKKNQSNSTAGVNKLKEDVHYQLQTFLLFEVFSISLSLHQHQWSHSWEAIKVTQLEMINERSVATTALNIGFFRPFFLSHCKDMFVYLCRFIIGSHIPPLNKFIWIWWSECVSSFLLIKSEVYYAFGE